MMSRKRGDRTMEVRPLRRRSEHPCTVDVAQKRSKQESMGKVRAGNVPTDRRDKGSAPAGRLPADWLGLIPRGWLLKRLRPDRYALHPGAWLRAPDVIDRRAPLVLQLVATRYSSLYSLRGALV